MRDGISVIIPSYREGEHLGRALEGLCRDGPRDVVVAAGSPEDAAAARRLGRARVVRSLPGRAMQLNAGAAAASGDILLFLHADTRLPPGAMDAVAAALGEGDGIVGGAFRLAICSPRRALRLVALGANLRARWLRRPLGDQALFVRREVFHDLGGYRSLPLMEDADLVRRLRRRGRLVLLELEAETSARRWETSGILRTTAANWLATLLFELRLPPRLIATTYYRLLREPRPPAPGPAAHRPCPPPQAHAGDPGREGASGGF